MFAVIFGFIAELFGKWLNRTPQIAPVAEQLGKNEQAVKDTGEAYDQLSQDADAARVADEQQLRHEPGSGELSTDPAKDYPDIKWRD